jgi:hypothetical protein
MSTTSTMSISTSKKSLRAGLIYKCETFHEQCRAKSFGIVLVGMRKKLPNKGTALHDHLSLQPLLKTSTSALGRRFDLVPPKKIVDYH